MKAYSVLIGSPNNTRRFSRRAEQTLQTITARHFPDGFTILDAKGAWYDPARRTFRKEDARQVVVTTPQPARLHRWCRELGAALNQQEVVLLEIGRSTRIRVKPPSGGRPR